MRLLALRLKDFRQFRGRQELRFAGDSDRNVTLVYGANGTGKTTLLNAFTWALYGQFTEDLEQPEKPINKMTWQHATIGQEVSAEVEVEFEHEERRYLMRRVASARKTDGEQSITRPTDTKLRYSEQPNEVPTNELGNPDAAVSAMLPKRLHQFFFFNGERMERLAQHSAYEEIADATKTILGIEILDRAARHLPDVERGFERELKRVGSSEQQAIVDELDRLRERKTIEADALSQVRRNKAATDDEIETIAAKLEAMEESRALQEERRQATEQRTAALKRVQDADAELRHVITDRGFLTFTSDLGELVTSRFAQLESRGEIPTPIKRPFVERLLSKEECICGTPLIQGTEAYVRVAGYGESAGPPDVEQRWIRLTGEAQQLGNERQLLSNDLERIIKRRSQENAAVALLNEQIEAVEERLRDFPNQEVRTLEDRHRELRERRDDLIRQETRCIDALEGIDKAYAVAEEQRSKASAQDAKAALVQRRMNVTREATNVILEIYRLLQEEVRRALDERVKTTFKDIAFKNAQPEVTDDFELRLWNLESDGTRVPAARSTGENSILSLSFVGGLAALARDQADGKLSDDPIIGAILTGQGGHFPIVIDAAFGSLDEGYRMEVAQALPRLAPQVVALLSKGQASGQVNERLAPRRGRVYVITYYTPVIDQNETITIDGHEVPYIVSAGPEDERAELTEVKI